MNEDTGCEKNEGPVKQEIEIMNRNIDELYSTIIQLRNQLEPVSTPSEVEKLINQSAPVDPRSNYSLITNMLYDIRLKINYCTAIINKMRERLEL